jgi:hypothetical protein
MAAFAAHQDPLKSGRPSLLVQKATLVSCAASVGWRLLRATELA